MPDQPTLPLECGRRLTTRDRFEAFRRDHPEVERELVRLSRQALHRGKKVGIKAVYEVARWNMNLERDPAEEFKLNNNYTAHYARRIMAKHPDLDGFFETRGEA